MSETEEEVLGEELGEELGKEEKPLIRIQVGRRAARLTLNKAVSPEGKEVSAKVYVDGNYIGHYAPETLFFGKTWDGDVQKAIECDEGIKCDFGVHEILVDRTAYNKYYLWEYSHNFQLGDDITQTPHLRQGPFSKGNLESVEWVDWDDVCAFVEFKAINLIPRDSYVIHAEYGDGSIDITGGDGTDIDVTLGRLSTLSSTGFGFRPTKSTYDEKVCIRWDDIDDGDCDVDIMLYHAPFIGPLKLLATRTVHIPYKPPPLMGTVDLENSIIPTHIFVNEPETFVIRAINLTEVAIPVEFRETLEFRGVTADKTYSYTSDWSHMLVEKDDIVDLSIDVKLPAAAIRTDELYETYDIFSILEGRVAGEEEEPGYPEVIIVSKAIEKNTGSVGEEITVIMILRNIGGGSGSTRVSGAINGTDLPTVGTPLIEPGALEEITFTYNFVVPAVALGSYVIVITIDVDDVVTDTSRFGFTVL